MLFGQKSNMSSNKFGQKNIRMHHFGHKMNHSKINRHHDEYEGNDGVRQSDLERNSTEERHDYHRDHNPAHR